MMSDRFRLAVCALLLTGCAIPPANGDTPPDQPKQNLTQDDCWEAGLFAVRAEPTSWTKTGVIICVEHVNP